MHYMELHIFALDLYLNNLNRVTWKRLKVTVCGLLPLSDMQILDWIMMMCQ